MEGCLQYRKTTRLRDKNNSTKSRADYRKKSDNLGIAANAIFGSSYIGGADPKLRRDIQSSDYAVIASGDTLDPAVTVVLAGLDFHINYLKPHLAFHYLCRPGVRFLLTSVGAAALPHSHKLFPGASSIAASLVNMTRSINRDVEPLAIGTPSQAMMDVVVKRFTLDKRTCMVGDRLNTDTKPRIEGKLGATLGVLTGVMREDDLKQAGNEGRDEGPCAYVEKSGDLLACNEVASR